MKIDINLINISQLITGWMICLIPIMYQKIFIRRDYVYMLMFS